VHLVIYLLLCLVVGFVGRMRPMGFVGYFLLSIIITPIGGLITILVIRHFERRKARAVVILTCPNCARELAPAVAAKYCAHCGTPV
jgi:hypothetical protein